MGKEEEEEERQEKKEARSEWRLMVRVGRALNEKKKNEKCFSSATYGDGVQGMGKMKSRERVMGGHEEKRRECEKGFPDPLFQPQVHKKGKRHQNGTSVVRTLHPTIQDSRKKWKSKFAAKKKDMDTREEC
jgi:hypothetical protein